MKSNLKRFKVSNPGWLLFFQIVIGLLGFVISGKLSQYSWPTNLLLLWLGITLGMYLGGVPYFFQKSFNPKKSLARFATTALGAFLPVLLLALFGLGLGTWSPIYVTVAPVLAFSALVFGLLGFFLPGWVYPAPGRDA